MELFDILSTIHDLSQKGAEFNEEIQQLSLTCMTLGTALENIGKIQKKSKKQTKMYEVYVTILREQLFQAKDLLKSVNEK